MATKPTVDPTFDTNLTNVTATSAGRKTDGYANGDIPTAGEFNYWMNLVYLWILWLKSNIATVSVNRFPSTVVAGSWAPTATDNGGNTTDPVLAASSNTPCYIDLNIPSGYKLSTLTIQGRGNAVATVTMEIVSNSAAASANSTVLHTRALGVLPASDADYTMNVQASASALTVTVAAAGGTFTRSAGSYITDGFFVGQTVAWTGFVNGGNNATKVITALTATVMTTSTTGLVNETSGAGAAAVAGVSPTLDQTFQQQLRLTASATGPAVKSLRYTMVPQ